MPYAKINPSGCEVWHKGLVKVRFDLFLTPEDKRYDERYKYVPVITEPYPGKVDKKGLPLKEADYQAWLDKLPHIWQLSPIVSHFIRFNPKVSQEEVENAILPHIPNFYKAWCEGWDAYPGGMRHGWDVATRWKAIGRPKRYDKEYSEVELAPRITACEDKLALIVASNLTIVSTKEGETFPSTDIDVGSAAINRLSSEPVHDRDGYHTIIDYNNAANDTGVIDTVDVYCANTSGGNSLRVGTFTDNGSASFTCNDAEVCGECAEDDNQFTGLDIDISSGEFIGVDATTEENIYIDQATSGGGGNYYKDGQYCVASSTQTYNIYAGDILSLYGTGETAGATTYDTTVSMSALLKAQDDATINLDAYLKAQDEKTVNLSALLKGSATESVDLDILLRALGLTKTAALDALIQETDSESVSVDALVKALGLSKTVALSVILGTGATLTVDIDALLRDIDSKSVDVDVLLKALNLSKTITVDTLLALVKQTETVDLDALLKGQVTEGIDIDIWLKGLALVQSINLDTLIQATGQEKTTVIDTLLEATDTETIDLDVILKGLGITKTVAIDVLLHGSAIETVSLDALLAGRGLLTVAIDLILKLLPEKALRFIIEVRDTSGNLLAILENAHGIGYTQTLNEMPTLDFNLPATDDKKEHLIWGNEIWLRDYRTGTLIRKFRVGQRRDRR